MTMQSIIKTVVLAAGICIFAIGLALAQTPPAPPQGAAPPPTVQEPRAKLNPKTMREACRGKLDAQLRGAERRDAMKKCMIEQRQAARGPGADTERGRAKDVRKACREELRNQRFTEDERKEAIQQCAAKSIPRLAKQLACRKEAEEKKLQRGDSAFRSHMRACMTRG